jgi:hypothetical protein
MAPASTKKIPKRVSQTQLIANSAMGSMAEA